MRVFFAFVIIIVVLLAALALTKSQNRQAFLPNQQTQTSPTPVQNQKVDLTASFTIVTGSITRNFSAKMYHNLSPDVYIESPNPPVVHVKKKGITWNDFFKTLPMQLTKDCLTTGTKETFCTGENGTLRFYLNNIEDKDLLDREIKEGDKVLIQFSNN